MARLNKQTKSRTHGGLAYFNCDCCGVEVTRRLSHFKRVKTHFCSVECKLNGKKPSDKFKQISNMKW